MFTIKSSLSLQWKPIGWFNRQCLRGTARWKEETDKEVVRKANSFGFVITSLLLLIYLPFKYWLLPYPLITYGILAYIALNILSLFLVRRATQPLGAFSLVLTTLLATVYFSYMMGKELQLHFMAFLLITMSNQLFREKWIRYTCFGLVSAMLIGLEFIHRNYDPVIRTNYLDEIKVVAIVNILIILLITNLIHHTNREANEKLARGNRFIKNFVAHVTHEMRTPINSTGLLAQKIKSEINKMPELQPLAPHIDMLLVSTNNALNLINNVQDLAMVEEGQMFKENVEKTFFLKPFFNGLVQTANIHAETKRMQIILKVEEMPSLITSDAVKLSHIINNLLSNAVKYGLKGTVIQVRLARDGSDHWTISVSNASRNGIPADKQALLFDHPFISNRNTDDESTGLGLYIVNMKVKSMNGRVELISTADKKVICTVRLPLTVGKTRDLSPDDDFMGENELPNMSNTRILIAEDEVINARALSMHLEGLGCQIEIAENGNELIRKAKEDKFDVIIMDYHMPLMNGEAAMRYLKQNPRLKNIPVIVTTGECSADSLDRLLAAGADAFVPKPIQQKPLRLALSSSRLLQQRRLAQG
ncbi:MAG: hybrid sensor histidine kinase/response regulator [Candidatus Pseudobacter hemicellulosilyticus]|uniref:histidine kinase n=1 Tax=Candidatus Pseudobacter hemicellulosilyticus TaxID=3121375 RepID=A0AAJ5WN36_9BACT|nr:MAG: hybrid sensor histidine kinase/response regulator [Pseudobacter sp.]